VIVDCATGTDQLIPLLPCCFVTALVTDDAVLFSADGSDAFFVERHRAVVSSVEFQDFAAGTIMLISSLNRDMAEKRCLVRVTMLKNSFAYAQQNPSTKL
jgi:hypothetical protein